MFIIVYKEGNQIADPLTLESYFEANKLPGEKYIFEWLKGTFTPYDNNGLWCYENGQKGHFVHGDYYLTDIIHKVKNIVDFVFRYKTTEDVVVRFNMTGTSLPKGLSYAIREILQASKFNSWADYQKHKTTVSEVERLRAEVQKLTAENEKLKNRLAMQKKRKAGTNSAKTTK